MIKQSVSGRDEQWKPYRIGPTCFGVQREFTKNGEKYMSFSSFTYESMEEAEEAAQWMNERKVPGHPRRKDSVLI
nr:MAG TPA: hypothetical protein [Caudoviricetes sp.]